MTLALLIAVPTALLAQTDDEWSLATEDTRVTVGVAGDRPVIRRLENPARGHNWIAGEAAVPLMAKVWVGEQEHALQWRFADGAMSEDGTTLTLTFRSDQPALEMQSHWRARPGRGPVEHWLTLRNDSGGRVTVSHQDSLTLAGLAMSDASQVWWIQRGGSNASTQGGTHIEPLTGQLDLDLLSNCDDGASPVPWLAVQTGEEHGLYVGWEFSGLGRIHAQADDGTQLDVDVGLMPEFRTDIEPGETFLVPPAFVGCYAGDIDEGAYSLHRWILAYLRPHLPEGIPDPILAYNLYLDVGGPTAKEEDVLRSAAFCRDLGFEAFMPDAMWFPECGDWRWDPARFPEGVTLIEEFVHDSGMKMALWCAWTNGGDSEHPDALSVRGPVGKPEWFDTDYPADWQPGPFYGGRICLGCEEAKDWAIAKTQWLAGNHGLDYLKHDCGPIITQCNKTTHRHHYGVDASYWATMGYYEVQEQLRAAFPHIILENCSGGGHIKDFGIIQRTHYTVTTDTLSNLPDRQSIYDSTFAMPPMLLQAYTYERAYHVPGDDPCSFLWRSAMMGAWQIDPTNTRIWTEDEKAATRRDAQIYKDWVRPMLHDVKVHHILPRPDGVHWDGMFYWSPGLKRGTLYIFRPDAENAEQAVRLTGLEAAKAYWVWSEDGSVEAGTRTGANLMQGGLPIHLAQRYTCDIVYLQDAALGKPEGLEAPGAFALGPVDAQSDAFTASAKLTWSPSDHARCYRVRVSASPDFTGTLADRIVVGESLQLSKLPPGKQLYWQAEAIAWGGKRHSDGPPAVFDVPELQKLAGVAFVSDMEWTRANAGADNPVRRDTNYGNTDISVGGKLCPKGIWTHAYPDDTPADVVVALTPGQYGRFVADAGVEDSAGPGSVQFQVLLDGQVVAESPVMRPGRAHRFDVDVSQAKEITLRVRNGGDGYQCDHAAWGMARFIEAGAEDPL